MTFKSDGQISEPAENDFTAHVSMGGFAFDLDQGIFIPLDDNVDYLDAPLPPTFVKKL